jgi:hypothetical protein
MRALHHLLLLLFLLLGLPSCGDGEVVLEQDETAGEETQADPDA